MLSSTSRNCIAKNKSDGHLDVPGFWMLLKNIFSIPARPPRNRPNRPGTAAPDPPDNVGWSSEIIDFRSQGGGPVGHPQGVQGKTLIFNIKYLPKASHVDLPSLSNTNCNLSLVLDRLPAGLGPETRTNGSGSESGAERTQH